MQCCAWQHTALSLLILLNEHSAVVDRSPFAAAVPPFPPLLCLLFCVVLTVLGRLSLTPLGRTLPMMMCITNTPFQEIPAARLSKTHEIMKIADLIVLRTPPSLCTSPTGYLLYGSHAWNTSSRHASHCCSLQLPPCHLFLDAFLGHSKSTQKLLFMNLKNYPVESWGAKKDSKII